MRGPQPGHAVISGPDQNADDRTLAQYFFDLGYGACWAEAFIRNGETPPFALDDKIVERAWLMTPETYDDHAEFDAKKMLADAAPDLLAELIALTEILESDCDLAPCEGSDAPAEHHLGRAKRIIAQALGTTKDMNDG